MPEGVSEQAMGVSPEAIMAARNAFGYRVDEVRKANDPGEDGEGFHDFLVEHGLAAAVRSLLESGELVTKEDYEVECVMVKVAEERAVRAERALADCKRTLHEIAAAAATTGYPKLEGYARNCLARLGSADD